MAPVDPKVWQKSFDKLKAELADKPASALADEASLEDFRVKTLGRSGSVTELLKQLKDLSLDDRKRLGPLAQTLKSELEEQISSRKGALSSAADEKLASESDLDLTLPPFRPHGGRTHPLTQTLQEMTRILGLMGFSWAEGPLVEDDHHNFTALNIPEHHSARDMHDTFYLDGLPLLMRTHTSGVQIRAMESQRPPLRIIAPGRVFRHEAVDATHSAVFHQVEGLYVDKNVTFADLKGTLQLFLQKLLGPKTKTLFRPTYFPFTEPSADVYATCLFCSGSGCAVCKQTGWIELLGAGIVHPNVFSAVGYDPEAWSGFAFGVGVERIAMLRLGVRDIRAFYENDSRFLKQFDESLV
jgi:phenylalanyl-tRNA synthetase alpha chain